MLFIEFLGFFFFILIFGYLIPAGHAYYKFYVRHDHDEQRIQAKRPAPGGIRREIRLSLETIVIFAVMATGLFQLYKAGLTSIYRPLTAYPFWYLPLSFLMCLVFHDTFFYWSHRLMHWRPIFKYVHVGHHKSITPTPWAIFAFQPLEAVIQFFGIILLVVLIPLHPLTLVAFLWHDTMVNTAGHTGYEIVPKWISRRRWFKGLNTVSHHDAHHNNLKVNFGSFFNVWDRWMGTFSDR
jgi:sterol desaturase/sphingolipid hydroxylase (fatty acid hydroxylase superfamily)